MNLGALLKDKLGSAEHEEEEHEESGSSAMDSFLDALESGDRGAAKAALNAAFHEHMMAMEDEDEEDADRGALLIAMKPEGDMHSDSKMKMGAYGSKKKKVATSGRKRLHGHEISRQWHRWGKQRGTEIEPYEDYVKKVGKEDLEYGDPRRKLTPGEVRRGRRNPAGWRRGLPVGSGLARGEGSINFEIEGKKAWPTSPMYSGPNFSNDPVWLAEHDKQLEKHFAKVRLQNKRDKVGQYSPREEARRKGWAKAYARKKKEAESR